MSVCGNLSANVLVDCSNPVVGGVDSTLYLINFDEWKAATVTESATNPLELTAITLATGDFIYKVQGSPNTVRPRFERARENGRTRYKHIIDFQVEQDSSAVKEQIQELGTGRYVAIVFTNTEYVEVYGAQSGLVIASGEGRNRYASDGVDPITLNSEDETLEALPPKNYVGAASPYSFATAKSDITSQVAA